MLRLLTRVVVLALAIVGATALAAGVSLWRAGISTKGSPGPVETAVARRLRSAAIPAGAKALTNPTPATRDVLASGLEHFADHCAICHANDGSGNTEMGRGLYPKAPDMRLDATQSLTDGELFYIVEHGVRFTGMPGWGTGTPEGETASWHLVRFVRHLPKLTERELEEMRSLNPRSFDEWREEEAARRFLEGAGSAPKPSPGGHKHPGGKR